MVQPYKHEPLTNFLIEENVKAFEVALAEVEKESGQTYPLIINGEKVFTEEVITSVNPANKKQVIGRMSKANKELAEQAIQATDQTFQTWKKTKPEVRASILFRAAGIVRRRKHFFSALMVKEAGKPWAEADADTAEAIDFMEYYGRQMLKLKDGLPVESRPIEHNTFHYIPLGVGVIISPWNFPFAIMAGMTTAALVSGNTVLLKPASTTPIIAAKFMEVLEEAGLPSWSGELYSR